MNCDEIKKLKTGYLDDKIGAEQKSLVENHLENCAACQEYFMENDEVLNALGQLPQFEAPEESGIAFKQMLEADKLTRGRSKSKYRKFYIPAGIAASLILFMAGFFSGQQSLINRTANHDILALKNEVRNTKELLIQNMLEQTSASKRIMAVNYAENLEAISPEIADALFEALDNDKSENVRLAALDALSKYVLNPEIKNRLVTSFSMQDDPIIQITMIQLMVRLNEKSSIPVIQKLIENENTRSSVKEQARQSLDVLI